MEEGGGGGGGGEGGRPDREPIPNATLSPPAWFCIKVNSGVGHFNVSLNCRFNDDDDDDDDDEL